MVSPFRFRSSNLGPLIIYSDANLAYTILVLYSTDEEIEEFGGDGTILSLGIFANIFVIIPYFSNVVYATLFLPKRFNKDSHKFQSGRAYLRAYPAVYASLVVISGGAMPSLSLVNSRIFGMPHFSMGKTSLFFFVLLFPKENTFRRAY